jgi:hypothetical protein
LAKLKERQFETETINAHDREIIHCNKCSYEYFSHNLKDKEEQFHTCGGKAAGLYRTFKESLASLILREWKSKHQKP